MAIIAYDYEADHHCIECTIERQARGELKPSDHWMEQAGPRTDEHGIKYAATDNEGNNIHPVFDTDQWWGEETIREMDDGERIADYLDCGDCRTEIAECTLEQVNTRWEATVRIWLDSQ